MGRTVRAAWLSRPQAVLPRDQSCSPLGRCRDSRLVDTGMAGAFPRNAKWAQDGFMSRPAVER